MDDGRRWRIARRAAAILVLLATWFSAIGLLLAGAGASGGTQGSLVFLAALTSLVAGLLLALGAVALAPAMRVPEQRSVWLFRLAAAALLLAAVLVSAVSFPETLGVALFMALLALATPWWGRR